MKLDFSRDGKKLSGDLYLPRKGGKHPLIIFCHGFGSNREHLALFARFFCQHGFACYNFDFIGGGMDSQSDGAMEEMSVLTEARDVELILDHLIRREDIDPDQIILYGASQGGFVASYVAGMHPELIKALICLYPAYVLQDDARKRIETYGDQERMVVMGQPIGRIYHQDALSFDIYDVIAKYDGPVLIIHGDCDGIVPLACSQRAEETFPHAKLIVFEKEGHGFTLSGDRKAADLSLQFLQDVLSDE